jgi:hypothetical protein
MPTWSVSRFTPASPQIHTSPCFYFMHFFFLSWAQTFSVSLSSVYETRPWEQEPDNVLVRYFRFFSLKKKKSWFPVLVSHTSLTSRSEPFVCDRMTGVIYHWGLRKLWEEGLKFFFFWKASVSMGCQIIKKGAFQRKLCGMWLHSLSGKGWKNGRTSKGSVRKRGRKRGGVSARGI